MNKFFTVIFTATLCTTMMTNCTKPQGLAANLDTTTSPKQDFYQYACGGWMANNPLKPEYSRFGTFDQLAENNREQLIELINGLCAGEHERGTNAQKIVDLYNMGMDSVKLNNDGAAPLAADLAKIRGVNKENLSEILATVPGVSAFFGAGVEADMNNAAMNTMYIVQGGLGMGDRDYYLEDNDDVNAVREAYKTYLKTISMLAGYSEEEADRMVANTMEIENLLAKASMSRVELRDPAKTYNPTTFAKLVNLYPNLNLKAYFDAAGVENVDDIVVGQHDFLKEADNIIATATDEQLADYLTTGYLASASRYLSDDFINAGFEFSKVLSGVEQLQPRWKRAMNVPNGMLGEALGQLYVEKYFPESSKERMFTMVKNLQTALGQHIDNLTWMSDETKARAHEKLNAFIIKIGYPDTWRDYSKLDIDPEKSYWENIQAAILFNNDFNMSDYGKPVDNTRWYMSPQTVNAYYNPTTNEICFPAGILQPPFFDANADDAVNYGAIGVVIGHEMTHGFDDKGRLFDKDGNLNDWWTDEDAAAFIELAKVLTEQFNEIIVLGDTHANGELTLGENIADQGGLRVAHTAYHNSLGDSEGEVIEGFTPDQRFYLAYANVWAGNIRDNEILRRTKEDPHSLGKWRVNATLRNLEPFFQAFDIVEGDEMFRPEAERVIIW